MPLRLLILVLAGCVAFCTLGWSAEKKKKSDEALTQTLEASRDPPLAVVADASKLTFLVSPLSAKGLLSQQIRDALKNLLGQTRRAQIVKLRAFVAGSGDLRRVPTLVSEIFSDRRLSIPAVTVVQVGALPLVGGQVLMEATAVDRKTLNANGLAFVSGESGRAKTAAALLASTFGKAGLKPELARQVTCFLDGLDHEAEVRTQIAAAFPGAVASYVQLRRDSAGESTRCEAVAALDNSPGAIASEGSAALAGPVRIALTGTQMGFGAEEKDIQLALDRLGKALEAVGASWNSVVMTDTYALSNGIMSKVARARKTVLVSGRPVAGTALVFEGLPSVDASFAIEAIAWVER